MKTAVYVDIYFQDSQLQRLDLVPLLLGACSASVAGAKRDDERWILFLAEIFEKISFFNQAVVWAGPTGR